MLIITILFLINLLLIISLKKKKNIIFFFHITFIFLKVKVILSIIFETLYNL